MASLVETARSLGNATLDLLFPPRCQVCLEFDHDPLCARCRAQVVLLSPPLCERCGLPLAQSNAGTRCAECRQDGGHLERLHSAARFDGPLRDAIHAFKYHGRTRLTPALAALMWDGIDDAARDGVTAEVDCIVPVPLHPQRQRARGYNQSELLAREIGVRLSRPLASRALTRVRATTEQIGLTRHQRRDNVRGAFAVEQDEAIRGQRILLIDDVCTTGATLQECARTLRRAGAARVVALTVARQL